MYQPVTVTADGLYLDGGISGQTRGLAGVSLQSAAAASTVVVRSGGPAGDIIAQLGAGVGLDRHLFPKRPIAYVRQVHVTITGASARVLLYPE